MGGRTTESVKEAQLKGKGPVEILSNSLDAEGRKSVSTPPPPARYILFYLRGGTKGLALLRPVGFGDLYAVRLSLVRLRADCNTSQTGHTRHRDIAAFWECKVMMGFKPQLFITLSNLPLPPCGSPFIVLHSPALCC